MNYMNLHGRSVRPPDRLSPNHKGFSKPPEECPECGSRNVVIKYCSNSGAREHTSLVGMWVGNSGGFVCRTTSKHFHMYCKKCGYWD